MKQNYNRNEKEEKQGPDNPKFKLKTKTCMNNASEDVAL
jgi:hypothetical protein